VAGNATQTAVLGLGTTLGVAAMALALLPAVDDGTLRHSGVLIEVSDTETES
jgi:hypothetical protein